MSSVSAVRQESAAPERAMVDDLVRKGRVAMRSLASASQARVDEAVTALAWSIYKPEHAKALAELAVKDTGLGNVPDKIVKKQRKTFGTLRDLMRAKTVGVIEEDGEAGPRQVREADRRGRPRSARRPIRAPHPSTRQ